jgi:hypothetical protein
MELFTTGGNGTFHHPFCTHILSLHIRILVFRCDGTRFLTAVLRCIFSAVLFGVNMGRSPTEDFL